jgi:hypothetical protein
MRRTSRFGAGLLVLGALVASTLTSTSAHATVRVADVSAQAGPTASALLAKLTSCSQISSGKYRSDSETSANIPVCGKNGAVWYKADLDIDCDGQRHREVQREHRPVVPGRHRVPRLARESRWSRTSSRTWSCRQASGTWDYRKFGIQGGGVVAVIYNNRVEYAVVGDTGPTAIIGEASYATAVNLGINPNPENGRHRRPAPPTPRGCPTMRVMHRGAPAWRHGD